jgi:hypothetical protein
MHTGAPKYPGSPVVLEEGVLVGMMTATSHGCNVTSSNSSRGGSSGGSASSRSSSGGGSNSSRGPSSGGSNSCRSSSSGGSSKDIYRDTISIKSLTAIPDDMFEKGTTALFTPRLMEQIDLVAALQHNLIKPIHSESFTGILVTCTPIHTLLRRAGLVGRGSWELTCLANRQHNHTEELHIQGKLYCHT